jgi:hypothetical protein
MATLKVPDSEWRIIADLARRPEHLRTPPQMANYLIKRALFDEQRRMGKASDPE